MFMRVNVQRKTFISGHLQGIEFSMFFRVKQLFSSRHKWIESSVFLLAILFWIRVELTNNLKKFTSHELLICEMLSSCLQGGEWPCSSWLSSYVLRIFCTSVAFRTIFVLTPLSAKLFYFFLWALSFSFSRSFNGFFAYQHQEKGGNVAFTTDFFFIPCC